MKRITLILVLALIVLSVFKAASQEEKRNKIELGCHATLFFDERGFQFDDQFPPGPLYLLSSIGYTRYFNKSIIGLQFKLNSLNSSTRHSEYLDKGILNKSFREAYGYHIMNIIITVHNKKYFKTYVSTGLIHRSGADVYFPYISAYEEVSNYRFSHDIGLSLGFRLESKAFHNFFLYIQPQYNFYVYRQDKHFLQNEIIGNAGIGYSFNFKRNK